MINILVVGELCEDNFIYGECKRLCPEAPVPVMRKRRGSCSPTIVAMAIATPAIA